MDAPALSGPDPLSKLRRLAGRLVDEIIKLQESCIRELGIDDQLRMARTLTLLAPLVDKLFAAEASCPPKTGDQLRQEDDAVREEFEKRLAALLRGWEIAGSLGADPDGGSPPRAPGLEQLDASASAGAGRQRLAPVARPRWSRLGKVPGRGGVDQA